MYKCYILGALASVAGGARNQADWAWLTGSRVAQKGFKPLLLAAKSGHETAIRVLLAAKADIRAKTEV